MSFVQHRLSFLFRIFIVTSSLLLLSCNPAEYQKAAQDFHDAIVNLRQAYFLELELSNRARIERGDLEDQVAMWVRPVTAEKREIEGIARKMLDRRQQDIHEGITELREKAFSALQGYASVLVSLSSGQPTEAVTAELSGLVKDVENVLATVEKVELISEQTDKVKAYTGPLKKYVGVVNVLIELIADIAREKAIVETIGRSNDSVLELLAILGKEADMAHNNALQMTKVSYEILEAFMKGKKFSASDNEIKFAVARNMAELQVKIQRLESIKIGRSFDVAREAQGMLVKKAMLKDAGDWMEKIREFRERAQATKDAIDRVLVGN